MKWFLMLLAIGLTNSDKLDRTYLPPPGAQFAGGNPGDIQAPPDPFKLRPIQIEPTLNELQGFAPNGQPQTPVTTTSYAFTQTTTFPSIESYETTALPIKPVTDLPGYQNYNHNLPGFAQNQGLLAPGYNANLLPGYIPKGLGSDGQPINIENLSYTQAGNQPQKQHSSHNLASIPTPGINIQIPGSVGQPGINQDYAQYPDNGPDSLIANQYLSQNVNNEGTIKFPSEQLIPGQQKFTQPTASLGKNTANNLPKDQYKKISSQRPLSGQTSQGTYTGRPINVQDAEQPQGYQNQGQLIPDRTASQQPYSGSQNIAFPGSILGQNIYQPGQDFNSVSSTTPFPGSTASTSAYSSVYPIIRSERPQAAADRNAVILNYENVRTPTAYSYSYDTSNGIHADETGTVGDGTRAQGSYSYTGDDGKIYSVTYTADENGFQPHGDHLPTPPPIPEAIKRVIEQAARDKEAGIIDDGSYDEAKYGYKRYHAPTKHRRPQTHGTNIDKSHIDGTQDGKIIPITRITDDEYDESIPQDQLNDNGNNGHPDTDGNRRISNYDSNATPFIGTNDNQRLNKHKPQGHTSELNRGYSPGIKGNNKIPQGKFDSKTPTEMRYPGTQIEDNDNYSDTENQFKPEYDNNERQDIDNYSPGSHRPGQFSPTLTGGSSVNSNREQSSKQVPKGSNRPSTEREEYLNGKIPQSGLHFNPENYEDIISKQTDAPLIATDYGQNNRLPQSPSQETIQQVDENGYHYNTPQTQFPTRFKEQKVSSPVNPKFQTKISKGTTARPFLTPEVYNQPSSGRKNNNQQSTTRQPFMTSRVTTPQDSSYSDYDDGEEYYVTNQDSNDKGIDSTMKPTGNVAIGNRRPILPNISKPQYTPSGLQGTRAPGYKVDNSNNVTLDSIHDSTIPSTPSQNSRFGNTESPHTSTTFDPSTTTYRPSSLSAVGRPVLSQKPGSETSDYEYHTTGQTLRYPGTTEGQPDYGSHGDQGQLSGSIRQNYPTSTYYDTRAPTTTVSTVPTYQSSSGAYQPGTDQTGYYYEPQRPTSGSFIPGTHTVPNYYQTTYQQGPVKNTGTIRPSTPSRPGTFILSGSRTTSPESSPIETHQSGYQYGPTTPGPYGYQTSPTGYEYGPAGPAYSTTESPSTIGTTPGSFIPPSTTGHPVQGYSTTQQPGFPSTQEVYSQSPIVDGFGRPIVTTQPPGYLISGQQPSQYPGVQLIGGQDSRRTGDQGTGTKVFPSGGTRGDNQNPTYYGAGQSTNYPGSYDQSKIIGEDFSGPKQPQRFDPQTGYHY